MCRLITTLAVVLLAGCASPLQTTVPDDPDFAPVIPEDYAQQVIPTGSLFNTQFANKEQLLKELYKKNKPGCSEVTFKLLGFSLSSLNLMTNIVFLLISAHIYRNEKK